MEIMNSVNMTVNASNYFASFIMLWPIDGSLAGNCLIIFFDILI